MKFLICIVFLTLVNPTFAMDKKECKEILTDLRDAKISRMAELSPDDWWDYKWANYLHKIDKEINALDYAIERVK